MEGYRDLAEVFARDDSEFLVENFRKPTGIDIKPEEIIRAGLNRSVPLGGRNILRPALRSPTLGQIDWWRECKVSNRRIETISRKSLAETAEFEKLGQNF